MTTDNRWAMLCKLKAEPFDDPGWVWQRKYDGCRMRVDIDVQNGIALTARSGADKTAQFPDVVQALALTVDWGACPMELDGELVSANGLGFQEFSQRRMNRTNDVELVAKELPAKYVVFDVMLAYDEMCREQPLRSRLALLARVRPGWCELPEWSASGTELFGLAKAKGWEGVVGKRLDEPYMPGRRAWVKVKVWRKPGVFAVTGFTRGTGRRAVRFGALMLGRMESDGLIYHVGDCGTGLTDAELDRLDGLRRTTLPYCRMALGESVAETYDGPGLARVRVKFVEETNAGSLRFPVYLSLVCPFCGLDMCWSDAWNRYVCETCLAAWPRPSSMDSC